ncbi:hypothetical protein [Flavobacterium defluvii]|uniref:Tetratricopeptide repeat-containing protein n=1 Tax=Flavobacterium defluvii TaxID=370979 RepID=A0A1M5IT43_9FLAO|nr:hypothetical protein [Flavobacterium defluvii]SHG31528.1 hypothetical protein SAMN05443663_102503 [Flavobacterium defluvii]
MKWFVTLKTRFKSRFSKSGLKESSVNLEKGKQLYLTSRFQEAIVHLNNAVNSEFDSTLYELRASCFQKLDYHYKAIEDFDKVIEFNPLEFSYYYSRAVSKKAIYDFTGQIEDLHNCIHYYKKNKNIEMGLLKTVENDLITASNHIERLKQNIHSFHNTSYLEIKSLIRDCLQQIKKIKPRNAKLRTTIK